MGDSQRTWVCTMSLQGPSHEGGGRVREAVTVIQRPERCRGWKAAMTQGSLQSLGRHEAGSPAGASRSKATLTHFGHQTPPPPDPQL